MSGRKQPKHCTCSLDTFNKSLAPMNVRLVTAMQIDAKNRKLSPAGPFLAVERIDPKKKNKLPLVLCDYCPLCGKRKS